MENSSQTQQTLPGIRNRRGRNLQLVGERAVTGTQSQSQEMGPITEQQILALQTLEKREADLRAKEEELQDVISTIRIALGVVGSKSLAFISMLAAIVSFGYAVYEPTGLRISAACLLTAIVFLPALWADARKS